MTQLIIVQGLPGSGKSTWAERYVADHKGFVIVELDRIREQIAGTEYFTHNPDNKVEKKAARIENDMIADNLVAGNSVICSDTNLGLRKLSRLVNIARRYDAEVVLKPLDVSVSVCKNRNRIRRDEGGRFVPTFVIDSMARMSYGSDGHLGRFTINNNGGVDLDLAVDGTEDSGDRSFEIEPMKNGSFFGVTVPNDMISPSVEKFVRSVGSERAGSLMADRNRRDGTKYHLTVVTPAEVRQIGRETLCEAFSGLRASLTLHGIGKVSEDGREAFYVIVESADLDAARKSVGLGDKDFHITIGFDRKDIFSKRKDMSTEVVS